MHPLAQCVVGIVRISMVHGVELETGKHLKTTRYLKWRDVAKKGELFSQRGESLP